MSSTTKRTRRSPEDRIAALQAEIERISTRAAVQKVRRDPCLRHISRAVRSIDKAMGETGDKATRTALAEARATLAACLALNGAQPGSKGTRNPRPRQEKPDADRVLAYLARHPGSRSEQIAAELGTDTDRLRPALHRLRDDGKIQVEGIARATRYAALVKN